MDVGTTIVECIKAIAPAIIAIGTAIVVSRGSQKAQERQIDAQTKKDAEIRKQNLQEQRYIEFVTLLSKIRTSQHDSQLTAELSAVVNELYLTADEDVVEKMHNYLSLIFDTSNSSCEQSKRYRDFIIKARNKMGLSTNDDTFPMISLTVFS